MEKIPVPVDSPTGFVDFLVHPIAWKAQLAIFFIQAHAWLFIFLSIIGIGGGWGFYRLRVRQQHLKKIWEYTLFFLSKRQMILPLVYRLAKEDGLLDKTVQQKILEVRETCRAISFREHPQERLREEKVVSRILYDYFSKLEQGGYLQEGSRLQHIVRDLEFIDKKLVNLQRLYNQEVQDWNAIVENVLLRYVFRIFGFTPQEPFI